MRRRVDGAIDVGGPSVARIDDAFNFSGHVVARIDLAIDVGAAIVAGIDVPIDVGRMPPRTRGVRVVGLTMAQASSTRVPTTTTLRTRSTTSTGVDSFVSTTATIDRTA